MASGPITSWQTDGKTMETMRGFIFLGSKITADGDCSHEIKRCLLLGREAMTNLDSILKSRGITLLTKVHLKKIFMTQIITMGVITHLEPDIQECEVKWALGSITTNKASGGDGIPVELFQILKDDAVKVLHSICQQI